MDDKKLYKNRMKFIISITCIVMLSIPMGLTYYEIKTNNIDTESDLYPPIDNEINDCEGERSRNTRSGDDENWSGMWTTRKPMPVKNEDIQAGVVNNQIHVLGHSYNNKHLKYDPITDTWTEKASIPGDFGFPKVAVVNSSIYIIGKPNNLTYLPPIYIYYPNNDTWFEKKPMPNFITKFSVGVVNDKIYVMGGWNNTLSCPSIDTWEYNPFNESWTKKAPILTGRRYFGIGVVNNKIYTIGGYDFEKDETSNIVEEYDPITDTWSNKTSMPTRRNSMGVGVVNNKIYVIGGFSFTEPNSHYNSNIVEEYDPTTDSWIEKESLPTPRRRLAVGVVENYLFAIGGGQHEGDIKFNVTEEFNPNPPHHIMISPSNATIKASHNQQFNAVIYDKYNITLNLNVNWEATNGTINENGLFYPYTTGNWTIYANFSYDSTTISQNTTITVNPGDLYLIVITPNTWIMYINESKQFIAKGYDVFNNNVVIFPTWSINCDCTITQDGLLIVDGICLGTYTVYANQSNIQGMASVTIIINKTSDTDSDGIPDWWEIEYNLDPFNGSDANLDPDLDYLTNIQEFHNYSKPNINDTDSDSLGDGFEVIFSKTNASLWDTNGNGVGDGLEFIQSKGYLGWIESLPNDWIGMTITWDNYTILVKTNSSVLEGEFDKEEQKLKIKVSGPEGTQGVTEIDVPKNLCEPDDIEIMLDGELINYTITGDDIYYYIHVEYNHSFHELSAEFSKFAEEPSEPEDEPNDPEDDEKGILANIYLIALIIAVIIILLLSTFVIRNRDKSEDIGVQELPPEKLSILLDKKHAEGKITDETYNDAKSLLEKYRGD